ncbi:MAG: hypothetical protein P1U40_10250 [Coxiellaceae bacterium]|nr:hypothetical protein [Coxiellaceae bacterium]
MKIKTEKEDRAAVSHLPGSLWKKEGNAPTFGGHSCCSTSREETAKDDEQVSSTPTMR